MVRVNAKRSISTDQIDGSTIKKSKSFKPNKRSIKSIVKQLAETKIYGEQLLEQTISSAATGYVSSTLSQISTGAGSYQRIGDKVSPIGIHFRYIIHNNAAIPVYVRVVLVEATKGNFTLNTDNWLTDAQNGVQALTAERLSDVNFKLNEDSFKVLYDKTERIAGLGDGTGVETVFKVKDIKLSGSRKFETSAAGDSNMKNVRLLVVVRGADNDTAANVVEMTYNHSYMYKDL